MPGRVASWKKEGPRSVLAKQRREQRGVGELAGHEAVNLEWVGQQHGSIWQCVGVGKTQHDALVGVHHLYVESRAFAQHVGQCHRPWRVHGIAKRREDAKLPIAKLITEAFDGNGAVRWQRASKR
jgi:hypothetical protein